MEGGPDPVIGIVAESATRTAYRFVKERLLDGRYPGGMLLSENELARRLGISRTPVRQAMVQLEGEGLLELYPRRGALVKPILASEPDDVLEARLLIETHCARRAASAGAALAESLRASITDQEASLQDGGAGFVTSDREFHHKLVAANRNEILVHYYDGLRDRQQRVLANTVGRDLASIRQFIAEHREIADAIERGEGAAAAELIDRHLRHASQRARRTEI